jgi:hypothetical protein
MKPHDRPPEEPQAPARLVHALKAMRAERVFVPPSLDEAILRRARQQLEPAPARIPSPWWRAWMPWVAAAASLCLVMVVGWLATSRTPHVASVPEDVNGDGQVDVLDAFQLARELEAGKPAARSLDLDQDGVVDRADVELIARHAVRLTPEEHL